MTQKREIESLMLKHFLIIGAIALVVGLVHGGLSERGFNMPKKAKEGPPPPIIKPDPEKEIEPQPTPEEIVLDTEKTEEPDSEESFPVELLYEYWSNNLAAIVDARSEEEFAEGHIPMAIHLPLEGFDNGIPESILALSTDYSIIVYCGGGDCHASEAVGSLLTDYGYTNVFIFEQGYSAWIESGYPVESLN